ncbi:hypothetical protein HAX54_028193, partial [Datura stramonium]|nr:hypothetical protein [Datura stramonium]
WKWTGCSCTDSRIGLKAMKLVGHYKCEENMFASKLFDKMLYKNVLPRLCVGSTLLKLGEQQHSLYWNARPNSSSVKEILLMFVYSKFGCIEGFIIYATKFSFNNSNLRKLFDKSIKHYILKQVIRVNSWFAIAFGIYQSPWFDIGQALLAFLDNEIFDTRQGTNGSK